MENFRGGERRGRKERGHDFPVLRANSGEKKTESKVAAPYEKGRARGKKIVSILLWRRYGGGGKKKIGGKLKPRSFRPRKEKKERKTFSLAFSTRMTARGGRRERGRERGGEKKKTAAF